MCTAALCLLSACASLGLEGPAQTEYTPAKGSGPIVIVISGQSGPSNPNYSSYASKLASLGYYTILLDGKDILTLDKTTGADSLRAAMRRAQHSPHAASGKAAIIGFSLGGGAALFHAASMPSLVSAVVTYYPFTSFTDGATSLVQNFRVPVLIMAGGRDDYKRCCLAESARAMETMAKQRGAQFELVVYPEAEHNFNHPDSRNYRRDDDLDAWQRTVDMLSRYQPLE
jgi:dienelactone hydrolase